MPPRLQPSGAQNRKRQKRLEEDAKTQRGSLNKFLVRYGNSNNENPINNEKPINNENPVNNKNPINNENIENDNVNVSEDDETPIEQKNENLENSSDDEINYNIFNVRVWDGLDSNMKDLLISKGPIRETNLNYPKDGLSRHFSCEYYVRKLRKGDSIERKWLIYSKELDKVFCFCCKLFKTARSRSQLAIDGINDWKHLSKTLNVHENSSEHMINLELGRCG